MADRHCYLTGTLGGKRWPTRFLLLWYFCKRGRRSERKQKKKLRGVAQPDTQTVSAPRRFVSLLTRSAQTSFYQPEKP